MYQKHFCNDIDESLLFDASVKLLLLSQKKWIRWAQARCSSM